MDVPVEVFVALIASAPGLLALWSMRNRNAADVNKAKAETDSIHAQVADRWAEHVSELQARVDMLTKQAESLLLDVAQVRRENERYRLELAARDLIIGDLKDWAERLIGQLAKHAPEVKPEQFYRVRIGEETNRRLRSANQRYDRE